MFRIGPNFPHVTSDLVGLTHCVVKEYNAHRSYGPRTLSAAAEAAAAVAAGGAHVSTPARSGGGGAGGGGGGGAGGGGEGRGAGADYSMLGSSPPSSFGYELACFMQATVAQPRSSARR